MNCRDRDERRATVTSQPRTILLRNGKNSREAKKMSMPVASPTFLMKPKSSHEVAGQTMAFRFDALAKKNPLGAILRPVVAALEQAEPAIGVPPAAYTT